MSPVPKAPPVTFLNGEGGYESADDGSLQLSSVPDGEVMKATMTDVQKALEQLGCGGVGGEDGTVQGVLALPVQGIGAIQRLILTLT